MQDFKHIKIPAQAAAITVNDNKLFVPDRFVVPFITGDGIGADIMPVMQKVVEHAVKIAYGTQFKLEWVEIYAGEKAESLYGNGNYLPAETLAVIRNYKIAIKGPLATPIASGFRSINVALRQALDLYACVRPVCYFAGIPSVVKAPEKVNMVIFRENLEDLYAGIEWQAGSNEAYKLQEFLVRELGVKLRAANYGLGIKLISEFATKRLATQAIKYALAHKRRSVTVVHKGNIMKYTEGSFRNWVLEYITALGAKSAPDRKEWLLPRPNAPDLVIKEVLMDAFLQEILLKPQEFDVILAMNLNGDYISDAIAAMVGGIGIAPGANLGDEFALFEATHGTAPEYAGKNQANPAALILAAEMLLRYIGLDIAADLIVQSLQKCILNKTLTHDFARFIPGSVTTSTSQFGEELIKQCTNSA